MQYSTPDSGRLSKPITPSNTVDLGYTAKALYVGTGGTAVIVNTDGTTCSLVLLAGTTYRAEFIRVNATGTTATNLVAIV